MNVTRSCLLIVSLAICGGCTKTPSGDRLADTNGKETAAAVKAGSPSSKGDELGQPESAELQIAGATAAIAPDAARKAGIEVMAAGPARIQETLTLYGSIRSNGERQQEMRARFPGVVKSVRKRAGDPITKGEELLSVESNDSLQLYPVRSPLTGQVLDRRTNPGDAVDGSTILMTVADLSSVWVEFALFARDLGHVRAGMTVLFRGASAEERGEAKLTYVAPAGHAESQSVVARAVVDNRRGRWVPGQFITGDIVIAEATVPVAVKPVAVQQLQGKTMVFVQSGRGFEARPVQVGMRSRDAIEITTGLAPGERYAATNSYLIKADLMKSEADED